MEYGGGIGMKIRPAKENDAEEITKMREKTIKTYNLGGYSKKQLDAELGNHTLEKIKKKISERMWNCNGVEMLEIKMEKVLE
jgi:hypothetical protein